MTPDSLFSSLVKRTTEIGAAILVVGSVIGIAGQRFGWFAPFLAMPGQMASLQNQISAMGGPDPSFVEYQPPSVILPTRMSPGQRVMVIYTNRQNKRCETLSQRRFRNLETMQVDHSLTSNAVVAPAPRTLDFSLVMLQMIIPNGIAPGFWSFEPRLTCGNEAVEPPPIFFEVTG